MVCYKIKHVDFPRCQLSCYIVSCFSMFLYIFHFTLGLPLFERVKIHNRCEIILLVIRGINEYMHKKLDLNDVLHHGAFLLGSCIVFTNSECAQFGFLLSHMQCLHFPMTIWYGCCRRATNAQLGTAQLSFQTGCASLFCPMWILCVAYRATIMLNTLITSAGTVHAAISAVFFALFLITAGIDVSWSGYFFSVLGPPSPASITMAAVAGCALGAAALYPAQIPA